MKNAIKVDILDESVSVSQDIKCDIIQQYVNELVMSGYSLLELERYITPGLVGFIRRVKREQEGGVPVHRKGDIIKKSTFRKNLTIQVDWFKKQKSKSKSDLPKYWGGP